ncbi:hypothetical protein BCR42DRAFT_488390 [Absidia repens]|uniref:Uncharacterized protein n=1 Tax=Absidia repens TaxID=90262 RepID=A0A1X2IS18_9FUNG|nr:hypothetical protein BCR42DRAFT_488390 [Absidia repens]
MSKVGKALAVSMGALAGGAGGFYLLEAYKIKTKTLYIYIKKGSDGDRSISPFASILLFCCTLLNTFSIVRTRSLTHCLYSQLMTKKWMYIRMLTTQAQTSMLLDGRNAYTCECSPIISLLTKFVWICDIWLVEFFMINLWKLEMNHMDPDEIATWALVLVLHLLLSIRH